MQHAQPFDRFPWRAAALAAAALALAELAALLALAGIRLVHSNHAAAAQRPAPATHPLPKKHAVPLRPRSRVSVLVLNGNGIQGAAGTEATRLLSAGYRHATAADAPQPYVSSLVLFRPGWQQEAKRLARDAKIRTVTPLDGHLSGADSAYRLVLILGAN